LLVRLKTINQSTKPGKISESIHGFLIIKKLHTEITPLLDKLALSPEATRYYAEWVIKAKVTQITDMVDDNRRYLHLMAFIAHQFKMWQDTLVDVLLKSVQHYLNKAEIMVNTIRGSSRKPQKFLYCYLPLLCFVCLLRSSYLLFHQDRSLYYQR